MNAVRDENLTEGEVPLDEVILFIDSPEASGGHFRDPEGVKGGVGTRQPLSSVLLDADPEPLSPDGRIGEQERVEKILRNAEGAVVEADPIDSLPRRLSDKQGG